MTLASIYLDSSGRAFELEPSDTVAPNAVLRSTGNGRVAPVLVKDLNTPVWQPERPPMGADHWLLWLLPNEETDGPYRMPGTEPTSTDLSVDRSVDGGKTWARVVSNIQADTVYETVDWQGLARGDTLYKVTATAPTGASSETVIDVPADSGFAWLAAGPTFEAPIRLAYNPAWDRETGRARATETYLGRDFPVAYAGENLSDRFTVSGSLLRGDGTAQEDDLVRVAQAGFPVHLWRDGDAHHVYASVGAPKLSRENRLLTSWSLPLVRVDASPLLESAEQ